MGQKQLEIVGKVIPMYREMAGSGQIEISTTPYYHPILPLLCDSNIASVSHPGVPLPPPFRYPGDAEKQLVMARHYVEHEFGVAPAGLWPSEGSVSDETFSIAAAAGFRWAASDSGVLGRTLGRSIGVDAIYRPYRWEQNLRQIGVVFRDHFLSDLIGFVYSGMDSAQAARDFLNRIRENCRGILAAGRDALVPIILDGENAWEYYDRNGRPFLRHLYRLISGDAQMSAVTVSEAIAKMEPEPLTHVFPGSWINANFDVWIGAEEDNQAWSQLLRARESYQAAAQVPDGRAQTGLRRAADRRRQRLVLVVRPRTRFRQSRGIRSALPQPPSQRLSFSESQSARGAITSHFAHGGECRAHPTQRTDSTHYRWRSDFLL